jgi:hypothetical protein
MRGFHDWLRQRPSSLIMLFGCNSISTVFQITQPTAVSPDDFFERGLFIALMMDAVHTSEMLVYFETIKCYIPESCYLHYIWMLIEINNFFVGVSVLLSELITNSCSS